jgi:hypothetical protein
MKIFRAYADEWRNVLYSFVEVRLHETRVEMLEDLAGQCYEVTDDVQGQCSGQANYNKAGRLTGKFAVMWLNADDVRANPAEVVSHECVHAAMRHAMNRKADLSHMDGEEVLAYTQGCLFRQINRRLHELKVFA